MMPMNPNLPSVGDRVKIVVTPHDERHTEGVVRQVCDGPALGIEFDAMPDMVHHWYLPSEVMVTDAADPMEGDDAQNADKPKKRMPHHAVLNRASHMAAGSSRPWYRVENKAEESAAELFIYDVIGASFWEDSITAKQFIEDLQALPDSVKTLRVRINSPGGDPFDATAIANFLRTWASKDGRTVETIVDGLAASAASIIAMAGSTVRMADNALFMIHDPWTLAIGNAAEMRKMADTLDSIRDSIVATYRWHAELSDEEIRTLMADETWMDADDAITYGFATEKVEGLKAAALIDPKALAKLTVPDKFKARISSFTKQPEPEKRPTVASAVDVLSLCEEGGVVDVAKELIAAGATLDQVHARIASEKQGREAKAARATEITGICATAKLPTLAAGYINGGMSVADVRAQVQIITAMLDKVEIDANLDPDQGAPKKAESWKKAFAKANHRRG